MQDSDSEVGELRMDGSSARALTSFAGAGGGYIPFHKEPPRYIRVKAHNKNTRNFNHLFLAQELLGCKATTDDEPKGLQPATVVGTKILKHGDAIWAAEFSLDGRYLAVAGKDQAVRVFSVISTAEERKEHEAEEESHRQHDGQKLSAPVFRSKPTRVFEGHTGEVLALSWSKNGFLLSSSMDKTVKLWHMSRAECLCTFKHNDLVTSIAFHPTDDRFFLAGSLDAHLRLWSIPDKAVAFSAPANEFITAVSFSPDGKTSICGLMSGLCLFYTTEGLKLQSQLHVRSSRGKNAKGSKITGIKTFSDGDDKDIKVLISSNDSRVRIYNLRTKMLEVKFRGHENQSSQIHARFNDSGTYVVCGSEDRRAYVWSTGDSDIKDKQPYECFDAHPEVVTTAIMAPLGTRQLLDSSGDPIYDLCNPPPVTLMSLDEAQASQTKLSEGGRTESAVSHKKPEETPAYMERAKHLDGNIIVTTDRTGTIKVFRQDCAYAKRQQSLWETASKFSGRVASGLGRSGSIATRASGGSRVHSRRGSLNLGPAQQTQPASDRIMSWRQDVEGRASSSATGRSERSVSPVKPNRTPQNTSAANLASEARRQPYASSLAGKAAPTSPTSSVLTGFGSLHVKDQPRPKIPPAPSFSLMSASGDDSDATEDKDGSFWNLSRWRDSIPGLRGGGLQGSPSNELARRTAARRSVAIHDIERLKIDDEKEKASRRKSTGVVSQRPQPFGHSTNGSSTKESEPEPKKRVGADAIRSARYTPKERVDSGVAQVSDDGSEGSNEATCRRCGGHSFSSRKGQGGKLALRCLQCGEATA